MIGKQALVVFLILVLVQECLAIKRNEGKSKGGKKKPKPPVKVEGSYLRSEEEPPKEYIEVPGLPADEDYQPINHSGKNKKKDKKPKKDDGSSSDSYVETGVPELPGEEYREPGSEEEYLSNQEYVLPGGGDGYVDSGNNDGYEPGEHNDEDSYEESEGYEPPGGGDGYIDSDDDHGYEHEGYNDDDSYEEGYEHQGGGDGYIDTDNDHGYEHEGGSEYSGPHGENYEGSHPQECEEGIPISSINMYLKQSEFCEACKKHCHFKK